MREKLIELLESAESAIYWNSSDKGFIEKIADHLIASGVTVPDTNVGDKSSPAAYKLSATEERLLDENRPKISPETLEALNAIGRNTHDEDE